MTIRRIRCGAVGLTACLALAIGATRASAQSAIDDDTNVAHLRTSCALPNSAYLDNCFESTTALTAWLWNGGRNAEPSASDRVAVIMGPGDFGQFRCDAGEGARGFVTVIGSGRDHSRFVHTGSATLLGYCEGAITVDGCTELNFQDLTAAAQYIGVFWKGNGRSTWADMDMIGGALEGSCEVAAGAGWYDTGGNHYFFGSRSIVTDGTYAQIGFNGSGNTWFYGGEIEVEPREAIGYAATIAAVNAGPGGNIRVYGSQISARVGEADEDTFARFAGLHVVSSSATIRVEGSNVRVDASGSSENVTVHGIYASGATALVETSNTSFTLAKSGTGTNERVEAASSAQVHSPVLWRAGSTAPAIESLSGSDLFVDTDAGGSGGEAHLMVYDPACAGSGGPWRDMVGGSCR